MSNASDSDPDEALTKEEIRGEELGAADAGENAFSKLMAAKPKIVPQPAASRSSLFKDRMALGAYIADPSAFPPSTVVYYNDDFVVIHDKYPKATIHTLLLPRSQRHALLHPADAFEDPEFLAKVQAETARLKTLVATELQRKLGKFSRSEMRRQAVLNGDLEPPAGSNGQLPPGRDWAAEIKVGVHAAPSMGHLHIHVLSRDMRSPALRHRKHYNSFNTPFLVDVADFPLPELDPKRDPKGAGYMRRDLRCWRCGRNFGNRFKELKNHLDEEFEDWKKM